MEEDKLLDREHIQSAAAVIRAALQAGEVAGQEEILRRIFDARVDTAIEERLRTDADYQRHEKEISAAIRKVSGIGLSREQEEVVDDALSACNVKSAGYGRVAYCQGFMDAADFFMAVCRL